MEDYLNQIGATTTTLRYDLKNVSTEDELQAVRVKTSGRKSKLVGILRKIKDLPQEERRKIGKAGNIAKNEHGELLEQKASELAQQGEKEMLGEKIDLSFPGRKAKLGKLHPVTQMYNEVVSVFRELGFTIMEGPDIETDWHCFEMLRMPKDHPARDMQDTYYIEEGEVLPRTHTSSVQIRTLMNQKPPIKVLSPGRCYRNETVDPRHTDMFTQFEGLVIDEKASLKDMKATLTTAFRNLLKNDEIQLRMRHSHFPYTEPSIEIDGTCMICMGKGCRSCSKTGWVELCGAGVVHPEVLENFGIDSEKYQGYAFGPGIERLVMLRSQLPDLRELWKNDIRMLEQF